MALWDDYAIKSIPEDTDSIMLKDNTASDKPNKRTLLSNLFTWLQTHIHSLTADTTAYTDADTVLMDRNGTVARVDYSVLAKAIIEEYRGSDFFGEKMTLTEAISSVSGGTTIVLRATGSSVSLTKAIHQALYQNLSKMTKGESFTLIVLINGNPYYGMGYRYEMDVMARVSGVLVSGTATARTMIKFYEADVTENSTTTVNTYYLSETS